MVQGTTDSLRQPVLHETVIPIHYIIWWRIYYFQLDCIWFLDVREWATRSHTTGTDGSALYYKIGGLVHLLINISCANAHNQLVIVC